MSLISAKYVEPARGGIVGRHGAHYKLKAVEGSGVLAMSMVLMNTEVNPKDKICPHCLRTPFSNETEICPRCGKSM